MPRKVSPSGTDGRPTRPGPVRDDRTDIISYYFYLFFLTFYYFLLFFTYLFTAKNPDRQGPDRQDPERVSRQQRFRQAGAQRFQIEHVHTDRGVPDTQGPGSRQIRHAKLVPDRQGPEASRQEKNFQKPCQRKAKLKDF